MKIITGALYATMIQMVFLIGPGVLLTLAMSRASSVFARQVCRAIGARGYLLIFGWLGTAVHELSHAVTAVIFRHKIHEIKLFQIKADSSRLGYIRHSYDKNSVFQRIGNLFIGIAPVFAGALIIFACAKLLMPELAAVLSAGRPVLGVEGLVSAYVSAFFSTLWALIDFDNFFRSAFYLFLNVLFSVGSAMTLSAADLKGAKSGFAVLFGVLLIVNVYREILYPFAFSYWMINFIFFIYNLLAGDLLLQIGIILVLKVLIKKKP